MTASILSHLPLSAGSALLATSSRAGHWAFSRYMKAPLASTGVLAMVTLTALAGSNALYFQTTEHPSPFFAPAHAQVAPALAPAVEEQDVARLPDVAPSATPLTPAVAPVDATQTTGSVPASVPDQPVGNSKMFEVQKKLFELNIFNGTVDGYYGPKTANAIRTFEQRNGMKLTGSTDDAVLDAILSSDSAGRITAAPHAQAAPAPVAAPPAPVVQQASLAPAVAPAPVTSQPIAPAPQDQIVATVTPVSTGQQVFDDVASTAASTIDSIIAAVDVPRAAPEVLANPPIPKANVAMNQPMPAPLPLVAVPQAAIVPAPQPVAEVTKPAATVPQPAAITQAARSPSAAPVPPATDAELITQIQRGLASLGFFRAPVDGKPGAETARAIREFESFNNFKMTGQVKPDLVDLLLKSGATI